jgi:hypothetical protein
VRSTGSPLRATLLRLLAVGGLVLTAWLLGSAVAAADTTEEPGVPDQVAGEAFLLVDELSTGIDSPWPVLAPSVPSVPFPPSAPFAPPVPFAPEPQSAAELAAATAFGTLGGVTDVAPPAPVSAPLPVPAAVVPLPARDTTAGGTSNTTGVVTGTGSAPIAFLSGGVSGAAVRSGSTSNSVPEPLLAARAAEREARRAAQSAQQAPPAAEPGAPPVTAVDTAPPVVLPDPAPQSAEAVQDVESHEVDRADPAPAQRSPKPAPASAPTASSAAAGSSHDNSGGARGGIAAVAPQSIFDPPALWAVEQRTDARSPGSTPGLPSTSPD